MLLQRNHPFHQAQAISTCIDLPPISIRISSENVQSVSNFLIGVDYMWHRQSFHLASNIWDSSLRYSTEFVDSNEAINMRISFWYRGYDEEYLFQYMVHPILPNPFCPLLFSPVNPHPYDIGHFSIQPSLSSSSPCSEHFSSANEEILVLYFKEDVPLPMFYLHYLHKNPIWVDQVMP